MKSFLTIVPTLIIISFGLVAFYTAKNWSAVTNIMEEKHSFSEAVEAFKKGATIFRLKEYGSIEYGSETRTSNGRTKRVFGMLNDDGDVKEGVIFNLEDVMSDQWIIKWSKEESDKESRTTRI